MTGSGPSVRVGIVSWNTAELLDACLAALPAALEGLDAEVAVVDNDSSDGSADVARRHGVTTIVNDANLGYAVAMNQALESTAPVLIALNPDTAPPPRSLTRLVEHLEARPQVGVVVPRLAHADGRPQHSAYRFPDSAAPFVAGISTRRMRQGRLGRRLLLEGSGPHAGGPVDWAIGAVHVIRASALAGERPYSERSFMYAEDLDLCWRLAQRGAPTWLAEDVTIPHVGNAAGEQAWGEGRSAIFWAATYDVISQRTSPARTRLVAASCTAAAALSLVRLGLGGLRRRDWGSTRTSLAVRWRELGVHSRIVLHGPSEPPRSPPSRR